LSTSATLIVLILESKTEHFVSLALTMREDEESILCLYSTERLRKVKNHEEKKEAGNGNGPFDCAVSIKATSDECNERNEQQITTSAK
jgi:hypothetical protein